MSAELLVLAVAVVALAVGVWWLIMLIEALKIPTSRWEQAGQSQLIYVLGMFLLGVLGTVLYVAIARPRVRVAAATG